MQVFFVEQALDNRGTRGRRAEAFFFHRRAQLFVVDGFARTFHRRQQRGFRVARGWLGGVWFDFNRLGFHLLAGLHRREVCSRRFVVDIATVHGEPSGVHQHFAFGFECLGLNARNTRGLQKFGRRIEHGQKALDHEVVKLCLDFVERFRRLCGRDDGEVIGNFAVVENAFVRLHPAAVEYFFGEDVVLALLQHLQRFFYRLDVVFGECPRIGTRVGQHLVLLV